jgi:hypothetical protein
MADRSRPGAIKAPFPDVALHFPPLPAWLAKRSLRPGERITWVYGPWSHPSWERYITHPVLFLIALVLGSMCLGLGWLLAEVWSEALLVAALAAGASVLGSIFVLGISSGYFTRLVVTNSRIMILQGYEMCRSWRLDELPASLIRYVVPDGGAMSRSVDLDALNTMLGGSSDKVVDSKSILALGKHLDHIKARENRHT